MANLTREQELYTANAELAPFLKQSVTPATNGTSGPGTTRLTPLSFAKMTKALKSSTPIETFVTFYNDRTRDQLCISFTIKRVHPS